MQTSPSRPAGTDAQSASGVASSPPEVFVRYPELASKLPFISLGSFPTPVLKLTDSNGEWGGDLYVKRDDLSSPFYGGNKVRKLEHVLADALQKKCQTLITVGGLGSNQCLATALYGRQLGFKVDLCLFDQPVTDQVLKVLSADLAAGASLHFGNSYLFTAFSVLERYFRHKAAGEGPYYIPPGSTNALGAIGYVSAGLELARQVEQGFLPEPDRIFAAAGSCGTVAGLIVGLKLAGLKSRVVAVKITSGLAANTPYILNIARQTYQLLKRHALELPRLSFRRDDVIVESRFFGGAYGRPTEAAEEALRQAAPYFHLETTYTGKTFAACLEWRRRYPSENHLFWNTFNSAPLCLAPSWDSLPLAIRRRLERQRAGMLEGAASPPDPPAPLP